MQRIHNPEGDDGLDFLVLASPKSGTTWLQLMLSAHPRVHCAETRLFGRYFDPKVGASLHLTLEQYVRFVSGYYHPPCAPDGRDAYFDSLLSKLIATIAAHAREESGKPIYGEKITPYVGTGQQVMDRLAGLGKRTRLIHLVRDCRDVVVSGMAHWRRALAGGGERVGPEAIFEKMLENWVDIEGAYARNRDRLGDVLEVRYEDLLSDPIAQARRVFAFIGAECEAGVIEACVERTSFEALSGGRARGQVDESSFYRSGTAGQWKQRLSAEEIERIEGVAGELMEGLGYRV